MNNDQLKYNPGPYAEVEESEIDWALMASKLWKHKVFILVWSIIFAVLGVVVALNSTKKYSASITLAPEVQQSGGSSSLRSITSMLGMGGMQGSSSGDALNITLFPEMAASTPFLTDLFDLKVIPYTSPKDIEEGKQPRPATTLYRWILKKDKPKGFVAKMMEDIFGAKEKKEAKEVNPKQLTREQGIAVAILKSCIAADIDKKTGITTISVTIDDPSIAVQLVDTVCQRLQTKVVNYRTQKAYEDIKYYTKLSDEAKEKMIKAQAAYAASVDFDRSVILQSISSEKERLQQEASMAQQIYQQMEQQKVMAQAKYQELKPVFAIVQPATMPLMPTGTSRKMVVLAFIFVGFAGSAAWKLLLKEYVDKFLSDMKGHMNEKQQTETAEA